MLCIHIIFCLFTSSAILCLYSDVFLEFEKRRDDHSLCKVDLKYSHIDISDMRVHQAGEDKYRAPDPPPSTFAPCYSDSETEEEDDR